MRRAELPQYSSQEMILLTAKDKPTWDIFGKGYTQGINQCQSVATTEKLTRYKPRELRDLCAFVAAIRPGFKSQLNSFLSRQNFRYDVPPFDTILRNDSSKSAWMLYQENTMSALNLAGFEMERTYPIIKAISKKKTKVIAAAKAEFMSGFQSFLTDKQGVSHNRAAEQAELVWKVIEDSASYSFNACVSGSTKLFRHCGGRWHPTVEEMYRIKTDNQYAKDTGHANLHDKYRSRGYGEAHSMFDDYRVRPNRVVDIRPAGIRKTYRITTEDGGTVDCTDNHKFPTPNGIKYCSELHVGDSLYMRGDYEHDKFDSSFTDGSFVPNIPTKGQMGFQENPDGASVKYLAFRNFCVFEKLPCAHCGKQFRESARFEVHHRDMDRHNNEFNNYEWLCASCHKKKHYQNGRRKRGEKGYPVYESPIISIELLGEEMTYDIEMADPAHNFVTESGLITCNSHAGCVSLDAIYGAYLKAHHPHDYYSVLLEDYLKKGNKDKVSIIKQEMQSAFGMSILPCKFRQDNRAFTIDAKTNTVTDSLASIKSVSPRAASKLFAWRCQSFDSFVDLLAEMEHDAAFNKTIVDTLIDIDYFSEFGTPSKLKAVYSQFRDGKNKYSKNHIESTKQKRLAALRMFESDQPDEEMSIEERVSNEIAYYGYPMSRNPLAHNDYAVVETDAGKRIRIKLYNLRSGKWGQVYIPKAEFALNPLNPGDIIHVDKWLPKPAYGYANGQRIKLSTKEHWLEKYSVKYAKKCAHSA